MSTTASGAASVAPDASWPAGPAGRPLVGTGLDYQRDPIGYLGRAAATFGDVHAMGPDTLVVHDPVLIRQLLARTADFTADLPRIAHREGTAAARSAAASDEAWQVTRRIGWAGMTRTVIRAHGEAMLASLAAAVAATRGEPVVVDDVLAQWSLDAAVDVCLGPGVDGVAALVAERTAAADELASTGLTYPAWWPSRRVRTMVRTGRALDAAVDHEVAARRATPRTPARALVDLVVTEAGDTVPDEQVRRLLKANLLASHSAPGAALGWIAWELHRDPAVRDAVAAEAAAAEEPLSAATLPFAEAVVREGLRLHPPIWLLARVARRDATIGDWTVRAGQRVVVSPYFVQRDPRWWAEPERFRPDRWTDPHGGTPSSAWFPFGGGPRVCLGLQVALYQLTVATAWLAREVELEVVTPPAAPRPRPHLRPDGLVARLRLPTGAGAR